MNPFLWHFLNRGCLPGCHWRLTLLPGNRGLVAADWTTLRRWPAWPVRVLLLVVHGRKSWTQFLELPFWWGSEGNGNNGHFIKDKILFSYHMQKIATVKGCHYTKPVLVLWLWQILETTWEWTRKQLTLQSLDVLFKFSPVAFPCPGVKLLRLFVSMSTLCLLSLFNHH